MITLKTQAEIQTLKEGGKRLCQILKNLAGAVRPGVSTWELDALAERQIRGLGGEPSFKGYNPYGAKRAFPASLCVSINDEVVHGIPNKNCLIKDGDVVSLDIGMLWPSGASAKEAGGRGMYTDMAVTVAVGAVPEKIKKLIAVTEASLYEGIKQLRAGARIGDASSAIGQKIEKAGFGVVRDLAGHGVGYKVHEDPSVPNFGPKGTGPVLKEGMVLALEPMATAGGHHVTIDDDEWTFRTSDGSIAAHFEHTVVITKSGALIVTLAPGEKHAVGYEIFGR